LFDDDGQTRSLTLGAHGGFGVLLDAAEGFGEAFGARDDDAADALALARGIKPLNRLQQRIRKRESSDLSPIDEHDVPEEVAPLVASINDLLGRLDTQSRDFH